MRYLVGVGILALVCWASADDSYLTEPSMEIDSSEFGVTVGSKPTTCRCGWLNKDVRRIVGGSEAGMNEFPYMAGLGYMGVRFPVVSAFCGASIITNRHALTAAHCTFQDKNERLGIVVGEHDTTDRTESPYTRAYLIDKIIEHEGWNVDTFQNDIAIVRTKDKIEFNQYVGPVCLPVPGMQSLNGEYVKVTGWGHTKGNGEESPKLMKVNLRVIDLNYCKEKYPKKPIRTNPNTQLCTYAHKKDSCQGDSGGPVVWLDKETNRYTQVGVVSFGAGCATRIPGVNTDVLHFLDWIQKKIKVGVPTATTCSKTMY